MFHGEIFATTDSIRPRPSAASPRRKFSAGRRRMTCVPDGTASAPASCKRLMNWTAWDFSLAAKAGIFSANSIPSIRPSPRTCLITAGYFAATRNNSVLNQSPVSRALPAKWSRSQFQSLKAPFFMSTTGHNGAARCTALQGKPHGGWFAFCTGGHVMSTAPTPANYLAAETSHTRRSCTNSACRPLARLTHACPI